MCAQSSETALWTVATTATPGKGDDGTAAIAGLLAHLKTVLEQPAAEDELSSAPTRPAGRRFQQPSIRAHWPRDIKPEGTAPMPAAAHRSHCRVHAMHESAAGSHDAYLVGRRMQMRAARPTCHKLESAM